MTPVSDLVFETLHSTATEIFTGALAACNIESAFDRRMRFEGNVLQRLLPDGSGPETIDLSAYKRVFVIALGKAAVPMLDVLLARMKRRKGLRGICCTNQQPQEAQLALPLFRGRPSAAQRGVVCSRPRHARAAEKSAQRHAGLLPDFGRRLGDV